MLNDFTETIVSDNRPLAPEDDLESIVRGGTCIHLFKLPIEFENIKNYKVSYKQGLHTILEKDNTDCEIESLEIGEYVKVIVTPEESRLFNSYNKYTFVQIAVMLEDDSIIYSKAHKIAVVDSINDKAFDKETE